jgi:hypothetical protein
VSFWFRTRALWERQWEKSPLERAIAPRIRGRSRRRLRLRTRTHPDRPVPAWETPRPAIRGCTFCPSIRSVLARAADARRHDVETVVDPGVVRAEGGASNSAAARGGGVRFWRSAQRSGKRIIPNIYQFPKAEGVIQVSSTFSRTEVLPIVLTRLNLTVLSWPVFRILAFQEG